MVDDEMMESDCARVVVSPGALWEVSGGGEMKENADAIYR
jgi:hypothetical protein